MTFWKCEHCGSKNRQDREQCHGCGAPLGIDMEEIYTEMGYWAGYTAGSKRSTVFDALMALERWKP